MAQKFISLIQLLKETDNKVLKTQLGMKEQFIDQLRKKIKEAEDKEKIKTDDEEVVDLMTNSLDLEDMKTDLKRMEEDKSFIKYLLEKRIQEDFSKEATKETIEFLHKQLDNLKRVEETLKESLAKKEVAEAVLQTAMTGNPLTDIFQVYDDEIQSLMKEIRELKRKVLILQSSSPKTVVSPATVYSSPETVYCPNCHSECFEYL